MKDWISVKNRMPSEYPVIVYDNDSRSPEICAATYDGKFWDSSPSCSEGHTSTLSNVTHWMPLPQPPELQDE